jgi:hypothetical protein
LRFPSQKNKNKNKFNQSESGDTTSIIILATSAQIILFFKMLKISKITFFLRPFCLPKENGRSFGNILLKEIEWEPSKLIN